MSTDDPTDSPATRQDAFAQYGRNLGKSIVEQNMAKKSTVVRAKTMAALDEAATHQAPFNVELWHKDAVPVGILGGGMAGLYVALILSYFKVPFQILEATDRIGGRCFTYKFKEGGDWDYYDVGAMRFPLPADGLHGPHWRLKHLFDILELDLLDYIYKTKEGLMYFNGERCTIDEACLFKANELEVPQPYIKAGVDALWDDAITPLAELLINDMKNGGKEGWETLKRDYDHYSMRSFLQLKYRPSQGLHLPDAGLPTSVVNWMETFHNSTGSYDRALIELVLGTVAFGVVGPKVDWRCIPKGTSVLPQKTLEKAAEWAKDTPGMPSELVVMNAPVTCITPSNPEDKKSPLIVRAGGQEYRFSHVISTMPLPNFAIVDTTTLSITTLQRNAIRQLQYGPSIKIGMLFKSAWWKEYKQFGGQSFTDLPIRTIVYPSYGEGYSSKTLIASYCWTNDAERLGNLMGTGVDEALEDLVLRSLAAVHNAPIQMLRDQLVRTHFWDWNHNAWSGGAFAFFGPGQYEYLYDCLNAAAADGRLQWAGELLSVRHGWVVGALDSAWAVAMKYLSLYGDDDKVEAFYEKWGTNLEWDVGQDPDWKYGGSIPLGGGGTKLKIPRGRNLLMQHVISHNPNLRIASQ